MTCSVDGCEEDAKTKGMCGKHYARWRRHGTTECTTTPIKGRTVPQMLEHTYENPRGCWIWKGARSSVGYPMVTINYQQYLVSRLVFEHYNRPLEKGECVCHECDMSGCINPDHLFVGSHEDNSRDMAAKGRAGGQKYPDHVRLGVVLNYASGKFSQKELAELYGVSRTHVNRWVNQSK